MKKAIHGALFATVAGALTFGAAATLPVNASNLGAGSSAVVSCDTDGVDVDFGLQFGEPELVNAVVVNDIAAACLGEAIRVSLSDSGSGIIATGDLLVSDSTMIIPVTPVQAALVYEVSVTISGAGI